MPRTQAQVWIVVVAFAALATSFSAAPDMRGGAGALFALVAVAIAVCDMRYGIIPDEFNAAGFAIAMLHAAIAVPDFAISAMIAAALRGAVLGLMFLGLRIAYRRLRGRDGIGLGDVKLAVVAGAFLDWLTIPIVIEVAALTGLAAYGVRQFWYRQPVQATSRQPFGLFFAPAIWLGWLLETLVLGSP
jgi:leader peptidase (prepilin peptidase) / N-methyltransferase